MNSLFRVSLEIEVKKRYELMGTKFSSEVEHLVNLGEDLATMQTKIK